MLRKSARAEFSSRRLLPFPYVLFTRTSFHTRYIKIHQDSFKLFQSHLKARAGAPRPEGRCRALGLFALITLLFALPSEKKCSVLRLRLEPFFRASIWRGEKISLLRLRLGPFFRASIWRGARGGARAEQGERAALPRADGGACHAAGSRAGARDSMRKIDFVGELSLIHEK